MPETTSFEPSEILRESVPVLTADPKIPIILHLGQLRKDRGCEVLVAAMRHVRSGHLIFLGGGPLKTELQKLAVSVEAADRIHFLDPVSPDKVLGAASTASVGVTLLQGTCLNHQYALPNKLFEYISAGIPVLASRLPELERVVADYGLGVVVDEKSPDLVGQALNDMLSDSDARAQWSDAAEKARETFNWDDASQPFRAAFMAIS